MFMCILVCVVVGLCKVCLSVCFVSVLLLLSFISVCVFVLAPDNYLIHLIFPFINLLPFEKIFSSLYE